IELADDLAAIGEFGLAGGKQRLEEGVRSGDGTPVDHIGPMVGVKAIGAGRKDRAAGLDGHRRGVDEPDRCARRAQKESDGIARSISTDRAENRYGPDIAKVHTIAKPPTIAAGVNPDK